MIVKNTDVKGYTKISNAAINDNLSLKATATLSYLLSKPKDWRVFEIDVAKHFNCSRKITAAAFKELIEVGYIHRSEIQKHKKKTSYDYVVSDNKNEINVSSRYTTNIIAVKNNAALKKCIKDLEITLAMYNVKLIDDMKPVNVKRHFKEILACGITSKIICLYGIDYFNDKKGTQTSLKEFIEDMVQTLTYMCEPYSKHDYSNCDITG